MMGVWEKCCALARLSFPLPAGRGGGQFEPLERRQLLSQSIFYPTFRRISPITAPASQDATPLASPSIFTPALLRTAYSIDQLRFGSVVGDGTGQTIAIIDAYNAPTITSDLQTFDSDYGLPAPTLTIENQNGGTSLPRNDPAGPGDSWALETSLDVEWAHAVAPKANILLMLASSSSDSDLYTAVDTARGTTGVSAVSMSFGGDESFSDQFNDFHFTTPSNHAGVTFLAASGDNGAFSDSGGTTKVVGYPASSPNVVGAGGTKLVTDSSGNYSSESGWGSGSTSNRNGGSGGGISGVFGRPSYQGGLGNVAGDTSSRLVPDVAMDADPASGVAVIDTYDNFGSASPIKVGGTSLATPVWAGIIALTNQGRALNGLASLDGPGQTLPRIYNLPAADFHDITSGNNGYAAATGYDLVTGLGTPIVPKLVPDLGGFTATAGTPLVLTGPANYLKLDADGQRVDVWNKSTGSGMPSQQLTISQISTMSYTGTAGSDDSLTIDFSAGNPLVPGGLLFDGGSGSGNNSLKIIGDSGADSLGVNASAVTFGSTPITYANATTITIDAGAGADTLTQTAQPGGLTALAFANTTSADSLVVNGGEFTFAAPAAGTGTSPVTLGTLSIGAGASVALGTAASHTDRTLLTLSSLSIAGSSGAWTGTLDLGGNDAIIHTGSSAAAQTTSATLMDQIHTGFNAGGTYWTGSGITSSAAMADPLGLLAIGLLVNNNGTGSKIYGSGAAKGLFDGADALTTDILLKETIFGDTDLSGSVDAADYSNLDNGRASGLTGWSNGDFNYDGSINAADYSLIDNTAMFESQLAVPLAAVAKTPPSLISVAPMHADVQPETGLMPLITNELSGEVDPLI
jgi:hypothetical protein